MLPEFDRKNKADMFLMNSIGDPSEILYVNDSDLPDGLPIGSGKTYPKFPENLSWKNLSGKYVWRPVYLSEYNCM